MPDPDTNYAAANPAVQLASESEDLLARASSRDYLASLRWSRLDWVATPAVAALPAVTAPLSARGALVERAAFLVHSVLGATVRRQACRVPAGCRAACERPDACAYGRLFEAGPEAGARVMSGQARVPSPICIDADWRPWSGRDDLRFGLVLLGRAEAFADELEGAVRLAMYGGLGKGRVGFAGVEVSKSSGAGPGIVEAGGSALVGTLRTPVRLLRSHRLVEEPTLDDFVRDLNLRAATWGHHHQGMAWAPRWRFLESDARRATFRWLERSVVAFRRWSSRQQQAIPMTGVLGSFEVRGASRELASLLRLAAVIGLGKGGSYGLGRVRIEGQGSHPC